MVLLSSRSVEGNNVPKEKSPCGTLVVKKVHLDRDSDCVLYSDDMIRVYARLASVVPEGTTVQEATTSQSTYNVRARNKTSRHSLNAKSNYFQVSEYTDYARVLGDPGSKQAVCSKSRIKGPSSHETYNTSDSVLGRTMPELLVVTAAEHVQLGCIPKGQEQTLAVVDNTGAGMVNSVQCSSSAVPVVTQASISVKADKMESPEYAVVDKSKKSRRPMQTTSLSRITSNPCISNSKGGSPCEDQEPPVPPKIFMHRSDFALYKETSSKKSVIERVQGFTKSAKSALQRAFSTERICREEKLGTTRKLRRSQSFIKVLKTSMSRRGVKGKTCNLRETSGHASHLETADTENEHPLLPNHVWGQLIQLHVDGSQVVELSKPPKKPFGFFLARGTIRNCRGVFVSRMRDHETQKLLSGLIDIGDEILEIDGVDVKEKDIVEVNSLMSNKNNIVLTVQPYSSRLDV
ncbi:uncharacterized protein LOC143244956 [Tachypleus tridentatus]|uniref:uncharacterized protein LOC143244956 n=1 Tax=Tachypleus tridentatus TaxID=6853 RepID=UPI003FD15957